MFGAASGASQAISTELGGSAAVPLRSGAAGGEVVGLSGCSPGNVNGPLACPAAAFGPHERRQPERLGRMILDGVEPTETAKGRPPASVAAAEAQWRTLLYRHCSIAILCTLAPEVE